MKRYNTEKMEIALLAGGWSSERDVSIKSGESVYRALDRNKYNVTRFDPRDELDSLIKARRDIDLAFILVHGKYGEDGSIQGLLELLNIPFVGSGVLPSAMAFNKRVAKERYKYTGLNVIEDEILYKGKGVSVDQIIEKVGLSTVVKPVKEGSSIGVSICHNRDELLKGIEQAFLHDHEVMVEKYTDGRELSCCVIGVNDLEALPIVEIVPGNGHVFFDYEAKYTSGITKEICPAHLHANLKEKVEDCAKRAHNALLCSVWSRTDMILKGKKVYVLETNTIPGMTENSLVPLSARASGMSFSQLLDKLITLTANHIYPANT